MYQHSREEGREKWALLDSNQRPGDYESPADVENKGLTEDIQHPAQHSNGKPSTSNLPELINKLATLDPGRVELLLKLIEKMGEGK
jgi:hypothetical protein